MPASPSVFRSSGDLLADRRYEHACAFEERGELQAAAELLEQTVERAPKFASAWFRLGEVRQRLCEAEAAAAAFIAACKADPEDRHGAALKLVALGRMRAYEVTAAPYVEALFDQFAPQFDETLRERLNYRAPELLLDAIRRAKDAKGLDPPFGTVIDLGCGTGLMGAALKGMARRLIGVDLSSGMLALARSRGLYDDLLQEEMVAFLTGFGERADLIVAADALVYLPDLRPLCAAAGRILSEGGLLAFSVETYSGAEPYKLQHTLRYAHGEGHVRYALRSAGLSPLELLYCSTREEAGAPVPSLIAVGRAA